jgi:hypothetical protein
MKKCREGETEIRRKRNEEKEKKKSREGEIKK